MDEAEEVERRQRERGKSGAREKKRKEGKREVNASITPIASLPKWYDASPGYVCNKRLTFAFCYHFCQAVYAHRLTHTFDKSSV